ncbi:peritrophin-1-like [Drosophila elegans]|uniref:peritrophin-1-like n=1 Tax=Drosophila elegans TaxID=30023 RepID=UPI0007E868CF|nr:peritrophin-1-like [Drosophila elegans]
MSSSRNPLTPTSTSETTTSSSIPTPGGSSQGSTLATSTLVPSTTTEIQEIRPDCSNLPNGVFLRDPLSCNKYYVCLDGKAIQESCPKNLNFDIKRKVCNFPSLVDCSFDEVLETVTKKPSNTESTPDCKLLPNGAYIRDPNSCSRFYVCANGRPMARQCPRGLHFDNKSNFCNYPSLVQCSVKA